MSDNATAPIAQERDETNGRFVNFAGPGRKSVYTAELGDKIMLLLAEGQSLRAICREDGMPNECTVRMWALDSNHPFYSLYTRGRELGFHRMAEDLISIADDGTNDWMMRNDPENPGYALNGEHSSRTRLRLDTRKFLLMKCLPKIYGDKITLGGDADNPLRAELTVVSQIMGTIHGASRPLPAAASSGDRAGETDVVQPALAAEQPVSD